jgi:hypothetical protein
MRKTMPDDFIYSSNTSGSAENIPSGTSTSGSAIPTKVGFEGLWQSGWQSITSGSVILPTGTASITSTEVKTDNQDNLPKLKRVRRDFRWFKLR